MTNNEIIMFNAKFNVKYMNGEYVISGFDYLKNLRFNEYDFQEFLEDYNLPLFTKKHWDNLVEELTEENGEMK